MDVRAGDTNESSIGELFGRVAEDAKSYARAEIAVYRSIAAHRAGKARNGAIALVAALFLLNAALIALFVAIMLALALHIGPLLAGIALFVVVGIIGFLLVRYGAGKLAALSGDAEEKAALAAGEHLS
ncbi:phage holin family protein [Sphingosinicella sp. BN140058]|uniref:phage holin family protein n=1 Tax=Sphingosinicella sp. BN140058 TaxID=1892855 RepID=UPI0013EC3EE7|nr:phage holin family protein [Sphingosinicella sp. BN140058]